MSQMQYIPSPLAAIRESFSRIPSDILELILMKRREELEREKMALHERLEKERIDIERSTEARLDREGRARNALATITSIAEFLPEDTPIAEIPAISALLEDIAPGLGEAAGTIIPNKETLRDFLDVLSKEHLKYAESDEVERAISQYLGLGPSTATERRKEAEVKMKGLEFEETKLESAARAFTNVLRDPWVFRSFGRSLMGIPPEIVFELDGKVYRFNTPDEGRIYADLVRISLLHDMEKLGIMLDFEKEESKVITRMIDSVKEVAKELGIGATESVIRPMIQDFLKESAGDFEGEEGPFTKRLKEAAEKGDNDTLALLESIAIPVRIGVTNMFNVLKDTEPGRRILVGLSLQDVVSKSIGKELTPTQVNRIIRDLDKAGVEIGLKPRGETPIISRILGQKSHWGLEKPSQLRQQVEARDIDKEFSDISDPILRSRVRAAARAMELGFSEQDIESFYGPEVRRIVVQRRITK